MNDDERDKLNRLISDYAISRGQTFNQRCDARAAITRYVDKMISAARIPQPSPAITTDDPAKPTS